MIKINWYKKAQIDKQSTEIQNFLTNFEPQGLRGLAAEALKYDSFEEFEQAFLGEIKHGTYWHITHDPNFQIDPEKGLETCRH